MLVTGASQGIGKDLASGFASEGCDLYLVTRSAEKLTSIAADLRQRDHAQVRIPAADLTAPGAISAIVDFAANADVLINNAGSIPVGNLWGRGRGGVARGLGTEGLRLHQPHPGDLCWDEAAGRGHHTQQRRQLRFLTTSRERRGMRRSWPSLVRLGVAASKTRFGSWASIQTCLHRPHQQGAAHARRTTTRRTSTLCRAHVQLTFWSTANARQRRPGKLTVFEAALVQALEADARRLKSDRRTANALFARIRAQGTRRVASASPQRRQTATHRRPVLSHGRN